MGEVNYASAQAVVTLKRDVSKVEKDIKTYKAKAIINAVEFEDKKCQLAVTDVKANPKTSRVYYENLKQKEGEEYLKALLWTERCSNGIHIMYYTPK